MILRPIDLQARNSRSHLFSILVFNLAHMSQSTIEIVIGCHLDVVGDPLDEVGRVLILYIEHLFVDFLHAHTSAEHGRYRQIPGR